MGVKVLFGSGRGFVGSPTVVGVGVGSSFTSAESVQYRTPLLLEDPLIMSSTPAAKLSVSTSRSSVATTASPYPGGKRSDSLNRWAQRQRRSTILDASEGSTAPSLDGMAHARSGFHSPS